MLGQPNDEQNSGLIPRAFKHIFQNLQSASQKQYLVRASYIEIYNEEIKDLLSANKEKRDIKESPDKGTASKPI